MADWMKESWMKRSWTGEALLSLVFSAVGVSFWMASSSLGEPGGGNALGPAYFPKFLGAVLFLLGGVNFFRLVSRRAEANAKFASKGTVFGGALLSGLYIFLIPVLGYFYITPVFAVCLLVLLGYRNPLRVVSVSLGFTLVAYVLFYRLLSVALPV